MRLLCLLFFVAVAFGSDLGGKKDVSIEKLEDWTEVLEEEVRDLEKVISDSDVVSSMIDASINEIKDSFLARINEQNKQQYERIEDYAGQVKKLQHDVDEAKAREKQAIILAEATKASIETQIDDLNGSRVYEVNKEQQSYIEYLDYYVTFYKKAFLGYLNFTIEYLEERQEEASRKLDLLEGFVKDRKCEYGTGSFDPSGDKVFVPFKTRFVTDPSVAVFLAGFKAHADVQKYAEEYDQFNLDKYVSNVTKSGFYIVTQDFSKGMIVVNRIYCAFMACTLSDDVDLHAD